MGMYMNVETIITTNILTHKSLTNSFNDHSVLPTNDFEKIKIKKKALKCKKKYFFHL